MVGSPGRIQCFFRLPPAAQSAAGRLPAGRWEPLGLGWHRWWPLLLALTFLPPAAADRVDLDDGRSLLGRFALVPGINVDPEEREGQAATAVMCDDGLTRTFVPRRRVVAVEQSPVNAGLERIEIPQRVPEGGRRVGGWQTVLRRRIQRDGRHAGCLDRRFQTIG